MGGEWREKIRSEKRSLTFAVAIRSAVTRFGTSAATIALHVDGWRQDPALIDDDDVKREKWSK